MKTAVFFFLAAIPALASPPINFLGRHLFTEALYEMVEGNQMACKQTDLRNKSLCFQLGGIESCKEFNSWSCMPVHSKPEYKDGMFFNGVITTRSENSFLSSIYILPQRNSIEPGSSKKAVGSNVVEAVLSAAEDYALICKRKGKSIPICGPAQCFYHENYDCSNGKKKDEHAGIKITVKKTYGDKSLPYSGKERVRKISFKYYGQITE